MAKRLVELRGFSKVQFDQTSKKARVLIEISGDPTETTDKLKAISELLSA